MAGLRLSDVRFDPASPRDAQAGLLGHVSCALNVSLLLEGLAIRWTADGHLTLSFPAKWQGSGRLRFYLRPLDDASRPDIEHQIFRALGLLESTDR